MNAESAAAETLNATLPLYRHYQASPFRSIKHDSYFQAYEELFRPYVGRPITFVEVGVLDGGSLFMWREFFGPQARIVGVDFNPGARRWQDQGFEIHIGSQADPDFWAGFFRQVGPVDLLLDDGGHTNAQQLATLHCALPHIRDGGLLVFEDVHASYMHEFGNPSRHAFIAHCKEAVDAVNARSSRAEHVDAADTLVGRTVYALRFFESIVAFQVDRRRCFRSQATSNGQPPGGAVDFRHHGTAARPLHRLGDALAFMARWPLLWRLPRWLTYADAWLESRAARRHWAR